MKASSHLTTKRKEIFKIWKVFSGLDHARPVCLSFHCLFWPCFDLFFIWQDFEIYELLTLLAF